MQVQTPRFGLTYVFTGKQAKKAATWVKQQWDNAERKSSEVLPFTYRGKDAFKLETKTRYPLRRWNYAEWFPIIDVLKRVPSKNWYKPWRRFLNALLHRPLNAQGFYLVNVPALNKPTRVYRYKGPKR